VLRHDNGPFDHACKANTSGRCLRAIVGKSALLAPRTRQRPMPLAAWRFTPGRGAVLRRHRGAGISVLRAPLAAGAIRQGPAAIRVGLPRADCGWCGCQTVPGTSKCMQNSPRPFRARGPEKRNRSRQSAIRPYWTNAMITTAAPTRIRISSLARIGLRPLWWSQPPRAQLDRDQRSYPASRPLRCPRACAMHPCFGGKWERV